MEYRDEELSRPRTASGKTPEQTDETGAAPAAVSPRCGAPAGCPGKTSEEAVVQRRPFVASSVEHLAERARGGGPHSGFRSRDQSTPASVGRFQIQPAAGG